MQMSTIFEEFEAMACGSSFLLHNILCSHALGIKKRNFLLNTFYRKTTLGDSQILRKTLV